jgi:hypothetical protein
MDLRRLGLLVALPCFVAAAAQAHHSAARFDTSREVSIDGVVTSYAWKNPHVYLALEVAGPNGEPIEQEVEAGAGSVLSPLGLGPDSIALGERVTVRANPNRRGAGIVLGRELVKEDGEVLPLFIASRGIRSRSDAQADSIAGTWFAPREGFFGFNSSRESWSLTDAGRTALEQFDSIADATHAECIPVTAPTLMLYPVVTTVTVEDDRVVFDVDWMTSQRVVYTDGRGHPAGAAPALHGHSIGRWEGDTLVVETINFADHREGTALGIPSGAAKRLVERFSLADDRRHLEYEVRMDDPAYLAESVTFSARWEYRPDLRPSGEPCDLDVARRYRSE